jgi:dTDP-glucose 4,6-dehydratase
MVTKYPMIGRERTNREQMGKILVTGGAGFIGSNFIHYLLKNYNDVEVVNLDKLTYAGNLENLRDFEDDPRYRFVKGDICDRKLVSRVMAGCEAVVHFAAETHVDRSIIEAGSFITTDVFGSYVLLDEARRVKPKRFIHISTDEVYGSVEKGFSREDDPLKPSNPYSASKAGADRLAYSFFVTYHLPVIIVRASNNFGPYQYP